METVAKDIEREIERNNKVINEFKKGIAEGDLLQATKWQLQNAMIAEAFNKELKRALMERTY